MTLPIHRIAPVQSQTYVDLGEFLLARRRISGSGMTPFFFVSICIADGCFSFITPIFLHAGIIHLALNMLAQWFVSGQLEREMGTAGFFLVYFAAGIFG